MDKNKIGQLKASTAATTLKDKKPLSHTGPLALAISAALMSQTSLADDVELDKLLVEDTGIAAEDNPYAQPGAPYKAKSLSDNRRSRDIADTPATMTVVGKEAIADSGKTELKDLLSAQPGITLGTGEGGNSFGDRYIIRGYEARSDVFTDGLREPGLITREVFALEQVEISKGPSSTFAGRGSTGGAVNTVTKKANPDKSFSAVEAGLGTDDYKRLTFDSNYSFNQDTAVRFNLLYTEAETPDRAPAGEERQGILASLIHYFSSDLILSADYYHFEADDRTDPGHALDRDTGDFFEYDYVGQDGLDFQESKADVFTAAINYDMGNGMKLENKTRLGESANDYVVSTYSANRGTIRSFSRWQESDYTGNQTNLTIDKDLGGKRHTIVTGLELAREAVDAGSYTIDGELTGTLDPYNAQHNLWSGTVEKGVASTELQIDTTSVFLMDTVTLSDTWEVFGGLRYDSFDYEMFVPENVNRAGETIPDTTYAYDDSFVNGHLGAVYSPWDHGNVYASWSTSSNINGGEADAGLSCGYGGLCVDSDGNYANAEPEQSTNFEVGTKWNLNDEKLLLTAALFQTTKDDVVEGGNDSYSTGGSLNTGKNRVEGIEIGLSGNITPALSAQFGVALMDSEILESYDADIIGDPKANFADTSANFQLRYEMRPGMAVGGVVTYSSEMNGGQPDAGGSDVVETPDYTVLDLFGTYAINDNLMLSANVLNVADETYYTAIYRGGAIAYLGDGRSAKLSLEYQF